MKRQTKFGVIALVGLLAGIVWLCSSAGSVTSQAPVAPAQTRVESKADPLASSSAMPSQVVAAQAGEVFQERHVVSSTLREVLPSLDHTVKDWRTFRPEKVTVAPYADLPVEFEIESVREENGRTIWRGRNALQGASLVMVATENDWHAIVELPAADCFELHVSGSRVAVTPLSNDGRCGGEVSAQGDVATVTAQDAVSEVASTTTGTSTADMNYVDVVFFYDAATLAANDSDATALANAIVARLEQSNLVLANSQVNNLQWRFVAAYQVPNYIPTKSINDDLNLISYGFDDTQANQDPNANAVRQFVYQKCVQTGADQAVLFITGTRTDSGNTVGLAWAPNSQGVGQVVSVGCARSVVMWKRTSDSQTFSYVFATHEMAHNFGCQHDRANAAGAYDGDGKICYGYSFSAAGGTYGTVMSYTGTIIPYFSNPGVSFKGVATGLPASDSKAAFNAQILINNASAMAGLRSAVAGASSSSNTATSSSSSGSSSSSSSSSGSSSLITSGTSSGASGIQGGGSASSGGGGGGAMSSGALVLLAAAAVARFALRNGRAR